MGSKNWAENAKQLAETGSHFSDVCGGDDGDGDVGGGGDDGGGDDGGGDVQAKWIIKDCIRSIWDSWRLRCFNFINGNVKCVQKTWTLNKD